MGDSIRSGAGWASTPLRAVWNLLGLIIGAAFVIFLILIVLTAVSVNYRSGGFGIIYSEITEPLFNSGFGNFIKEGISYLTVPFSAEKQAETLEAFSWKSSIDQNSRNSELGVQIQNFHADRKTINLNYLEEDEEITASAVITAYSLEPMDIKIMCSTDEDKAGAADPENVFIDPESKSSFQAVCYFTRDSFEIEDMDFVSKRIKMSYEYEFTTEGYIQLYITKNKKTTSEIDDFFETVVDPNIDAGTKLPGSVYTKGPVRLSIRSDYNQPLIEGNEYYLDVRIDDPSSSATGKLKSIEKIEILSPGEINIKSDELYGKGYEHNLNLYELKPSEIAKLNGICSDADSILGSIKEDCWRSGEIQKRFIISISDAGENIEEAPLRIRVKYVFEDMKYESIIFTNV
ncbi:hypothetical protein J4425_02690 [Candidatus Woesearchaeota archaeon]|nr:hypothetical protein [Candidatus Woesearchaeota archaeon]